MKDYKRAKKCGMKIELLEKVSELLACTTHNELKFKNACTSFSPVL